MSACFLLVPAFVNLVRLLSCVDVCRGADMVAVHSCVWLRIRGWMVLLQGTQLYETLRIEEGKAVDKVIFLRNVEDVQFHSRELAGFLSPI